MFNVMCEPFQFMDGHDLGPSWNNWLIMFENYLYAIGIDNNQRKAALLLHIAGEKVREIYNTLREDGDGYRDILTKLNNYFAPKKSVRFSIFEFRAARQQLNEKLDEYVTRLRTLAKHCNFGNIAEEVKAQIVQHCNNQKLRFQVLAKEEMTLKEIMDLGRAYEVVTEQVKNIEAAGTLNTIHTIQKRNYNQFKNTALPLNKKTIQCTKCGGQHEYNSCPAYGKTCLKCKKSNHFARCCRTRLVHDTHDNPYNTRQRANYLRAESIQVDNMVQNNEYQHYFEQDEHMSNNVSLFTLRNYKRNLICISADICNTQVNFMVDTGAGINVLDSKTYESLRNKPKLNPCDVHVFAYNAKVPEQIVGKFATTVKYTDKCLDIDLYVLRGTGGCLLDASTCEALGVIKVCRHLQPCHDFPNLFSNKIGKFKYYQIKLHINNSIKPRVQPYRRIPFHLRNLVEGKLKKLLENDIIEPVEGPTPWVSPIVIVSKPDKPNEVRLCVDSRQANEAILRERYITPTLDDLIYDLNGATYISKIDITEAFHQLELAPESRYITVFATHIGTFRYKRLHFGISSATEVFHHVLEQLLHDIPGVKNAIDDILVHGKTKAEHDDRLYRVLKHLEDAGFTVNSTKCEFSKTQIKFFGMIFSGDGVGLSKQKKKALIQATQPTCSTEVRSFLGLASYCSRFIPDFATVTEPLWRLTHKDSKWTWNDEQEKSFNDIKSALINKSLAHFNNNWLTELQVDASPVGLAAVLTQTNPYDSSDKSIIAYASKSLTDTERRYSQTEKEAYAAVWACEKFQLYLVSTHFKLITDNKAVELIFNNKSSRPPARIERWNLRLAPFDFQVIHKAGKTNIADFLSRHPISDNGNEDNELSSAAEYYINYLADEMIPNALTKQEILLETNKDELLQKLKSFIQDKNTEMDDSLETYKSIIDEFSITSNGLILKNDKLVIPANLTQRVVNIAHEGHQGLVRTKQLIREKVWFNGIDKIVEQTLKSCLSCLANTPHTVYQPFQASNIPSKPWQDLSIDFYGPLPSGEYLLVIIDDFSKYPIIEYTKSTSFKAIMPILDNIFGMFGRPDILKSDNGPPFNSHEFKEFSNKIGFHHRKITPHWPRANGEVERFMKTIGEIVRIAYMENKSYKNELLKFLRNYRATPHASTKVAPSTLLFGYNSTSKLPNYDEQLKKSEIVNKAIENCTKSKEKMIEYIDKKLHVKELNFEIGDQVLVKQERKSKYQSLYNPIPYKIIDIKGSMIVAQNNQHTITRNSSYFKKIEVGNARVYQNSIDDLFIELDRPHNNNNYNNNNQNRIFINNHDERIVNNYNDEQIVNNFMNQQNQLNFNEREILNANQVDELGENIVGQDANLVRRYNLRTERRRTVRYG